MTRRATHPVEIAVADGLFSINPAKPLSRKSPKNRAIDLDCRRNREQLRDLRRDVKTAGSDRGGVIEWQ
jgi:hypothetical protein